MQVNNVEGVELSNYEHLYLSRNLSVCLLMVILVTEGKLMKSFFSGGENSEIIKCQSVTPQIFH